MDDYENPRVRQMRGSWPKGCYKSTSYKRGQEPTEDGWWCCKCKKQAPLGAVSCACGHERCDRGPNAP